MSRSGIQLSVPATGPIDWDHLDRVTMGDAALADEVLGLFDRQAGETAGAVRALPPETARLVHGLKGSARGIGAIHVAASAEALERALPDRAGAARAVGELIVAIDAARAVIAAHFRKA